MTHSELEKKLSKNMLTRRLIGCIIAIVFIVLAVVFHRLWKNDSTNASCVAWSMTLAIMSPFFPLFDFLFCRYKTIEKEGKYITVYRGMVYCIVYVSGREIRRIPRNGYINYIEAWITAEVRATVCFTRAIGYLAHISFSDHSESVEL